MGRPPLISLEAGIAGVSLLGLDTAPFIYFMERDPRYLACMQQTIRRVDAGTIRAATSTITLTEVLTQPKRVQNATLVRRYREILLQSRNLVVLPVDAAIAETSADLRARYHLRTPDALQIATSLHAGCEAFLTNDDALRRVAELRVLMLAELDA